MSLRHDAEIIGLVGLAHGTSHFFHLMLPPLFPWLMRDFALSYTEAGLLMTVFFVVSGVGQAVAGFVVDRVGARPVLFFGIAMLALSGLVLTPAYCAFGTHRNRPYKIEGGRREVLLPLPRLRDVRPRSGLHQ